MRLGIAEDASRRFVAAVAGDRVIDLSEFVPDARLDSVIRDWSRLRPLLAQRIEAGQPATGLRAEDVPWRCPLPSPPKFLLLAGNFRAHVVESGFAPVPEGNMTPQFFMKPATTLIGPGDPIPLTAANTGLDYEAELAVVMGKRLYRASPEEALDAVWGYTVVNDVSERRLNQDLAGRHKRSNDDFYDWLVGKWFDGSAPMGPYVVTADEFGNGLDQSVRATLNHVVVQDAPLSAMIHSVPEALVYISQILTLEPGDVVSMGTPSGVGMARGRMLQPGDVISCEVTGIGSISNQVVPA
jgi:2-keto-4-pentenoate hydratase/2-oxohepta-3-ene-1,7-dioic acid hydratase in catechol pathway